MSTSIAFELNNYIDIIIYIYIFFYIVFNKLFNFKNRPIKNYTRESSRLNFAKSFE